MSYKSCFVIPVWRGEGNFMYCLEAGSDIDLSKALLKEKITLLNGSIGSKISSSIFDVSKSEDSVLTLSDAAP